MTDRTATIAKTWGRRIQAARLAAGLSQPKLAAALEVTAGAVSWWETGRRMPSLANRRRLAEVLGIPPRRIGADRDACPHCGHPYK